MQKNHVSTCKSQRKILKKWIYQNLPTLFSIGHFKPQEEEVKVEGKNEPKEVEEVEEVEEVKIEA